MSTGSCVNVKRLFEDGHTRHRRSLEVSTEKDCSRHIYVERCRSGHIFGESHLGSQKNLRKAEKILLISCAYECSFFDYSKF